MRGSLRLGCGVGIAMLLLNAAAARADEFESIPPNIRDDCRIDVRLFYPSEEARQKDFKSVREGIATLERLQKHIPNESKAVLAALDTRSNMTRALDRLWIYGQVLWRQDSDNGAARREYITLEAEVDDVWTPMEGLLGRMNEQEVSVHVANEPGLKKYEWTLRGWRRTREHTQSGPEEVILGAFESFSSDTVEQRSNEILQGVNFGSIESGGASLSVQADYDELLASSDRSVRQEAFVRRAAARRSRGNTFAENLLSEGAVAKRIATFRKFASALDGSYYDLYLAPDQVERVLDVFTKHSGLVGRFAEANRKYVARNLKLERAEPWDLRAPFADFMEPRITFPDATDSIQSAVKVFGKEYATKLGALLNPKNHRLDLLPGPRKATQDITLSPALGGPSVFITSGYRGRTSDVVTLAHEAAHGVHMDLMEDNQVIPFERNGAGYLFEGMAKVNELLILDELAVRATDERVKTFYLRELAALLAEIRYKTMFWAVVATKFEIELAKKIAGGRSSAQDVHEIWMQVNATFDPSYAQFPDNRYMWAVVPNFSSSPRGYVKYLYAWIIATALYEKAQTNPGAVTSLVDLMKGGFTDEPFALLKKHLGIDLNDPATLDSALGLAEKRVKAFEDAVR